MSLFFLIPLRVASRISFRIQILRSLSLFLRLNVFGGGPLYPLLPSSGHPGRPQGLGLCSRTHPLFPFNFIVSTSSHYLATQIGELCHLAEAWSWNEGWQSFVSAEGNILFSAA